VIVRGELTTLITVPQGEGIALRVDSVVDQDYVHANVMVDDEHYYSRVCWSGSTCDLAFIGFVGRPDQSKEFKSK
jgi:hypothetical protein